MPPGVAGDRRSIEGAGNLLAPRQIRHEFPFPPAFVRRNARYKRAATRAATSRQGSPRRRRQDRHPPLDPNAARTVRWKVTGPRRTIRDRAAAAAKLSFAFRASAPRLAERLAYRRL